MSGEVIGVRLFRATTCSKFSSVQFSSVQFSSVQTFKVQFSNVLTPWMGCRAAKCKNDVQEERVRTLAGLLPTVLSHKSSRWHFSLYLQNEPNVVIRVHAGFEACFPRAPNVRGVKHISNPVFAPF